MLADNYFAFNGFESRAKYTIGSWSKGEHFVRNTVLYNADWGVYKPAAQGFNCSDNLVVATNYLGTWHDTAAWHLTTVAQVRIRRECGETRPHDTVV